MTLTATALEVRYGRRIAVESTDLSVSSGELVTLVGPNGAGKTSLLRAVAGLGTGNGRIEWRGRPLADMSRSERARTVAYLPQSPRAGWPVSVRELVELGRLPHRRFGQRLGRRDTEAIDRAMVLTAVDDLGDRPVDELSGGEHMRAQLARAFAVDAPVLLVDEPVASLDPYHQLHVMQLLTDYCAGDRLVIAVLHDLTLAARYCTRMLLMDHGRIAVDGSPQDVLTDRTLAEHYRIRAQIFDYQDRRLTVPWETLD